MRSRWPALTRFRALCLAFPETTETSSWGHPNFRADGTLDWAQVRHLLEMSYRSVALKRMLTALDARARRTRRTTGGSA